MKRVLAKYSVFIFLIIVAVFMGCGVKGSPVVLSAVPDNALIVQNMNAVASGGAVILKWDFHDKNSKIVYIIIEKSEAGSAGNECKSCPRTFERIGEVTVKKVRQEEKGYNSFSFTDNKVTQGKTYIYRLLLCDDFNICLKSATIEVNYK